ncbi:hypothetical protein KIN20_032919 [Parelaphostrongylus tenuis]|uniref:Uncharacterized protein n=1 Tax=Parelaphostrongylus tenuis TaxID=148309 RepID=A0AAD5R7I1_PARTN|nr:hypothetical protein KIN20_032919 [Parelaphostrongylus tenuis]
MKAQQPKRLRSHFHPKQMTGRNKTSLRGQNYLFKSLEPSTHKGINGLDSAGREIEKKNLRVLHSTLYIDFYVLSNTNHL